MLNDKDKDIIKNCASAHMQVEKKKIVFIVFKDNSKLFDGMKRNLGFWYLKLLEFDLFENTYKFSKTIIPWFIRF